MSNTLSILPKKCQISVRSSCCLLIWGKFWLEFPCFLLFLLPWLFSCFLVRPWTGWNARRLGLVLMSGIWVNSHELGSCPAENLCVRHFWGARSFRLGCCSSGPVGHYGRNDVSVCLWVSAFGDKLPDTVRSVLEMMRFMTKAEPCSIRTQSRCQILVPGFTSHR